MYWGFVCPVTCFMVVSAWKLHNHKTFQNHIPETLFGNPYQERFKKMIGFPLQLMIDDTLRGGKELEKSNFHVTSKGIQ